jgi:selenocysteine-specific elongation factor
VIVGTAGHIDHGKSALVRALTGTDPDRLKEEKQRGITIELGFAHATLPGGAVLSFVDVPGHERFVRHMLAGAHGIDAVVLVIAADESVMPQTREHFHICRLLGIGTGVIALTKCDAADADLQALAELEVRELVQGSFLEGAEIVRVSARSGQGLDELRAALARLAGALPDRPANGLLRLPIDRAFTMHGFGSVVTGTLVSGRLGVGDEVELVPGGARARVRGLQVHGEAAASVAAGSRAAVNLAGVEVDTLARGLVLAHPGTLRASSILDVEVSVLPGERPLVDEARVRVHVASAEVLARVRTLEADAIPAGSSGLAQLRLEQPAVAVRGDRLILRSYSPAGTLGGATVLGPLAPKRRRRDPLAIEGLRALRAAEGISAASVFVREAGGRGIELPVLAARLGLPVAALHESLGRDNTIVLLGREPAVALAQESLRGLEAACLDTLLAFHRQNPLRAAMPREELKRRALARAPQGALEDVLQRLASAGRVRLLPDAIALAAHAVTLTPEEEAARAALLEALAATGLAGLSLRELVERTRRDGKLVERMTRLLASQGLLARVGEDQHVAREPLESLKARVREQWPAGARLDVAGFKEMTGLTRKHVIPLLEYLDRERVTRRSGPDRFVLTASS